jgi:hypothetical protein
VLHALVGGCALSILHSMTLLSLISIQAWQDSNFGHRKLCPVLRWRLWHRLSSSRVFLGPKYGFKEGNYRLRWLHASAVAFTLVTSSET